MFDILIEIILLTEKQDVNNRCVVKTSQNGAYLTAILVQYNLG